MESQEFERLIADALSVEPLAGLEQRVLSRVLGGANRNRRLRLLAVPALAGVLAGVALVRLPSGESTLDLREPTAPAVVQVTVARAAVTRRSALTKPIPTPTQEEKALLAFASADPRLAAALVTELRSRAKAPLEIPPIDIKPIEIRPIEIAPLESGGGK